MLASREGHTEVVLALCQSGMADVGRQDRRGMDAVMEASKGGWDTVVQILLTFAPSGTPGLNDPKRLKLNSTGGHYEDTFRLPGDNMGGGSDTTNQRSNSLSLPDTAHEAAAKAFLSHADRDGNTALHFASSNGHLLVLRTLLAAGAEAERKNAWSWTPISYSATVAAEVYFKGLVAEIRRREEVKRDVVTSGRAGGLRVVSGDDDA
jgi:ankyrin repeat protein